MNRALTRVKLPRISRQLNRSYSRYGIPPLPAVDQIHGDLDAIDLETFRERAFVPEKPLHITPDGFGALPAIWKWFNHGPIPPSPSEGLLDPRGPFGFGWENMSTLLPPQMNHKFFATSRNRGLDDVYVPYEYHWDPRSLWPDDHITPTFPMVTNGAIDRIKTSQQEFDKQISAGFVRFTAPFTYLKKVLDSGADPRGLYMAQVQLRDLPQKLQDDLPTPRLVKEAGKGDIYDANLWLGIPPLYTPLHKDPNPNLFVQMAGNKTLLLFTPHVGEGIFREVMSRIGDSSANTAMRGEEMMMGEQRWELEDAIWSEDCAAEGLKCVVQPGEAVFIPKGWWHTIRSVDPGNERHGLGTSGNWHGINASVNWWFR